MKSRNSNITHLISGFAVSVLLLLVGSAITAQHPQRQSQELSEVDGRPVLIKHLPDHERVQDAAVFVTDIASLKSAVGDRPVLNVMEFPVGTEAVTAVYPQGRLVIVEFTNPQASADADSKIQQFLSTNPDPAVVYRRIGNYNSFVFETQDVAGAQGLLDQVKYEKTVQWLGEDPFLLKKLERYMVTTDRKSVV